MFLPTEDLVVSTNENDILFRFWNSRVYEKVDSQSDGVGAPIGGSSSGGVKTVHLAMDIHISSNFERLLRHLCYEANSGNEECWRSA